MDQLEAVPTTPRNGFVQQLRESLVVIATIRMGYEPIYTAPKVIPENRYWETLEKLEAARSRFDELGNDPGLIDVTIMQMRALEQEAAYWNNVCRGAASNA